jgi:DNA-binding XRE family transcriptional regulator
MTSCASEIIDHLIGDDVQMKQRIEQQRINIRIAQMVYEARTAAGLTHAQLARKAAIPKKVIVQLEEGDYDGNALVLLQRIAFVLGRTVNVEWSPRTRLRRGA